MSESSASAPLEGPGGTWTGGTAATATLPPGMEWDIPTSSGGGTGGAPPDWGLGGSSTPPPRQPVHGLTAAFVAVAVAVAAFLAAGPLHSRITAPTSTPGVTVPVGPFRGNGNTTSQSQPPPTSSSATANLSAADISTIAAKVDKGVVDIDTELGFQNGQAAGTGMILTANGEILTNNHVIDGATKITVTVIDTGKSYTAKVVGTDPTDDVAVIQLQNASGLKPITTAKASTVSIGDPVVAVGNAGGRGGTPSVAAGSVVALNQTITATDDNGANAERLTDLIQVDAAIEAGDSGGPLANASGDVIGMDSAAEVSGARFRSDSTAGYAITIEKAISVAQQIESGKATSTIHIGLPAFLGVQIAGTGTGNGNGRSRNTAPSTAGALIAGVEQGTPADDIGLATGDTITSVNGQAVTSASGLTTALSGSHPGDQVTIGWTDASGGQHSAKATLTTGPAD